MIRTPPGQVAVIGAGPTGLVAAIALARLGAEVILLAPPYDAGRAATDRRTTALLGASVDLLINLGVWQACAGEAAPIAGVRMVDDRGGLIRAPEILFRAAELGLERFGFNIANPALVAALNAAAERTPRLVRLDTAGVTAIEPEAAQVRLQLAERGELTAKLAVAADGRKSMAPAAAGIAVQAWSYPQAALVTNIAHGRDHGGIVTELHRRAGPLTTVPLPGLASSLVWAEAPNEAARLMRLDEQAFAAALEERLHGHLGEITGVGPRAVHALEGLRAEQMAAARVALVGEAAHVVPPIGAQGLNLGLRDAAALADCVSDALTRGLDVGGAETLAAYCHARAADVLSRAVGVDLLNRSLLLDSIPLDVLRGLGGHLVANIASLRRLLMAGGMAPPGPLPRRMQPGALP
jgi:2-octaprenyl-6-methoxyphenol hydroxylase